MKIEVVQKTGLFGELYNIAVNGKKSFNVKGNTFPFITSFELYNSSNRLLISIFKCFFSIKPKYKFFFNDESLGVQKEPFIFRNTNYFKNSYLCEYKGSKYEVFIHKGLKYSVFKNEIQVASFVSDRVNFLDEDGFLMECNNDSPKELFSTFIIILDSIYGKNLISFGGFLRYKTGALFEVKPFDDNWNPS
jgi:uncharacterized protein YxjI